VVAPGDALSLIAERSGLTTAEPRELNDLPNDAIRSGLKLKVPAKSGLKASPAAPVRQSPSPSTQPSASSSGVYEVAAGDLGVSHSLSGTG
jgi:LysM repeat protein